MTAAIYVYTNLSFSANGAKEGLERGGDIYKVYCGRKVGAFYDWFAALFCYMSFIVMLGGANSTAMQQWGFPTGSARCFWPWPPWRRSPAGLRASSRP